MKIKASLESVKSRKTVTDDIVYTATFTLYPGVSDMSVLMMFYRKPIEIEVEEVQG